MSEPIMTKYLECPKCKERTLLWVDYGPVDEVTGFAFLECLLCGAKHHQRFEPTAPSRAKSLKDYGNEPDDDEPEVACQCGFHGILNDLLAIEEDETLWCPRCKTWAYDNTSNGGVTMDAMRKLTTHFCRPGPGGFTCPCCEHWDKTKCRRMITKMARRQMKQDMRDELDLFFAGQDEEVANETHD